MKPDTRRSLADFPGGSEMEIKMEQETLKKIDEMKCIMEETISKV